MTDGQGQRRWMRILYKLLENVNYFHSLRRALKAMTQTSDCRKISIFSAMILRAKKYREENCKT